MNVPKAVVPSADFGGMPQLSDPIRKPSAVRGVEFHGKRYDSGNIPSRLLTTVEVALHQDDGVLNHVTERLLEVDAHE